MDSLADFVVGYFAAFFPLDATDGTPTAIFSSGVWPRPWELFRSYMMHAELVLLIDNSCEAFVTGS